MAISIIKKSRNSSILLSVKFFSRWASICLFSSSSFLHYFSFLHRSFVPPTSKHTVYRINLLLIDIFLCLVLLDDTLFLNFIQAHMKFIFYTVDNVEGKAWGWIYNPCHCRVEENFSSSSISFTFFLSFHLQLNSFTFRIETTHVACKSTPKQRYQSSIYPPFVHTSIALVTWTFPYFFLPSFFSNHFPQNWIFTKAVNERTRIKFLIIQARL